MSIVSPSPSGTKHLQFLQGRGAVLRVNLVRIRPVPLACLRHPAFRTPARARSESLSQCSISLAENFSRLTLASIRKQDGDLQLFGLEEAGILDNMPLEEDHISCVATLETEPYLLVGCNSGALRVAALLAPGGGPAEGVSRIASMDMRPYAGLLHP